MIAKREETDQYRDALIKVRTRDLETKKSIVEQRNCISQGAEVSICSSILMGRDAKD
jgi:hypothetical protein